jgi:hypothetical protein
MLNGFVTIQLIRFLFYSVLGRNFIFVWISETSFNIQIPKFINTAIKTFFYIFWWLLIQKRRVGRKFYAKDMKS